MTRAVPRPAHAVRHADGNAAAELLLQPQRHMLDVLHAVVEIVYLPAAEKLAPDGVAHGLFVLLHHERLHGLAVARRLLNRRDISLRADPKAPC